MVTMTLGPRMNGGDLSHDSHDGIEKKKKRIRGKCPSAGGDQKVFGEAETKHRVSLDAVADGARLYRVRLILDF